MANWTNVNAPFGVPPGIVSGPPGDGNFAGLVPDTPFDGPPPQQQNAGVYRTGTQNEAAMRQRLAGNDPAMINAVLAHARLAHAQGQLAKYARVARLVSPEFQNLFSGGGNPLQQFAQVSGAFTAAARAAGWADPRMYLAHLLAQSQHPHAQMTG